MLKSGRFDVETIGPSGITVLHPDLFFIWKWLRIRLSCCNSNETVSLSVKLHGLYSARLLIYYKKGSSYKCQNFSRVGQSHKWYPVKGGSP